MKRHHRGWIVMLAVLVVVPALLPAARAYPNIKINDDTTTYLQNEQQIMANPTDPSNVVAVWRDHRLGYRRVGVGASFDGGFTWSQHLMDESHYIRHSDPGLTVDRFGNFYAVLLSYTGDTSQPNGLFVQKSTDGGLNWGASVTVVDGVANVFEDKELIACDRTGGTYDGNLYVAWARFDYVTWDQICMVSRSTDGGASFLPPVTLESDYLQWPNPAVGPNGEVYVAWENLYSGLRIRRSDDGGASYGPMSTIDGSADFYGDINGGVSVFSYPAMDVDISAGPHRGRVHVAYMVDAGSSGTDLRYRYSDNGGVSWSAAYRLNDDPTGVNTDQFHPWLAVNPTTGEVAVMFYDRRNDPGNLLMDVYWTRSTDGGGTWSANERITTVSSDPTAGSRAGIIGEYNGLCSAGSGWNMIWTDTREGNQDAYTAPIRWDTPTPSPTVEPTEVPTATPTKDPTATPTGGPVLGVRIEIPTALVHPGDAFHVTGYLDNPGEAGVDVPVFFVLGAADHFWFWPSWAYYHPPEGAAVDLRVMDVPTGSTEVQVVGSFTWPDTGSGEAAGLAWYGAMLEPPGGGIWGEMAYVEWGFGP